MVVKVGVRDGDEVGCVRQIDKAIVSVFTYGLIAG